jgi:hypothetical protein
MWLFTRQNRWQQQHETRATPFRPRVDSLEDRSVPSTIIIGDGGGGSPALVLGPANAGVPGVVSETAPGRGLDIQKDVSDSMEQLSFNFQYLQLQNSMQSENRQYTAISNIFQTMAESVRDSIGNIR